MILRCDDWGSVNGYPLHFCWIASLHFEFVLAAGLHMILLLFTTGGAS
jgi:hypothetical protein